MAYSTFNIIYPAGMLIASVIRKSYAWKYRKIKIKEGKRSAIDISLIFFSSLGLILPLVFIFSSVLDFADYKRPEPIGRGGAGTAVYCAFIWLLWRSHSDIGKNWTMVLGIRENHILVRSGVFKYIRHPMYAAHWLWAIAQAMLLENRIAGFSFLVSLVPPCFYRMRKEEELLINEFGNEYREYMDKTGRILPLFR